MIRIATADIAAAIVQQGLHTPELNAKAVDEVYHQLRLQIDSSAQLTTIPNERIESIFEILDNEYEQTNVKS